MTNMVRLTVALNAASARGAQDLLEALRFLSVERAARAGLPGVFRVGGSRFDRALRRGVGDRSGHAAARAVRTRFTSLLAVVESAQEPQVQFDFVTQTRGLDYVEEVRADAGQ